MPGGRLLPYACNLLIWKQAVSQAASGLGRLLVVASELVRQASNMEVSYR